MHFVYRLCWIILQPLVRSYFRLTVSGCENIPRSGAVFVASNHCSHLDPPLIALGLPRQMTFLAKEELFSVPVLGVLIRFFGAHPVTRGKGDVGAIRTILRLMKEEKALLIFPEGTRSPDGQLQPLENGLAWMAMKSLAPVVPVHISGTYTAFPRKAWFPRPCKVSIHIGEPIYPGRQEKKVDNTQTIRYVTSVIEEAMRGISATK
jgi:1-acyl-sn-glycerol-3-phosphate acyltransferase